MQMLEARDRTIRKLSKKIDKLEDTLKRTTQMGTKGSAAQGSSTEHAMQFDLLKLEMGKTKKLEEIIEEITDRVGAILEDLSQDRSLTDNSQEIKNLLVILENEREESLSSDCFEFEMQRSISISQEWSKKIDILEGAFKSFRGKYQATILNNKHLTEQLAVLRKELDAQAKKHAESEELRHTREELKEERKQREKLRGLLDRTEFEKNELINRINNLGFKDVEVKLKTKEELVQYSKELNYRVKDLEKEKEDILKETNKEKDA
jgi:hypothetical protein